MGGLARVPMLASLWRLVIMISFEALRRGAVPNLAPKLLKSHFLARRREPKTCARENQPFHGQVPHDDVSWVAPCRGRLTPTGTKSSNRLSWLCPELDATA